MSNNTILPAGGGGDTITTVDISAFTAYPTTGKLGASVLYVGATPAPLSNANPLPISDAGGSITIDGSVSISGAVDVSGSTVDATGSAVSVTNAFALDSTLTGGSLKAIARGGAKGATTAADITSSSIDADHQALDVYIRGGGGSGGTSSTFGAAVPGTGTAAGFSDGTNMQAAKVFDADTGAGSDYLVGINLRRSASGGSVELLGQQTTTNSIPVVIASNQGGIGSATFGGQTATTADYDTGAGTVPLAMIGIAVPASGGPAAGGTASNPLTTQPTTSLVDNAAFTDGTTRVAMAGYVLDETPGTALTENDAAAARIDSKRAQVLVIEDATTRGQRAIVDSFGSLQVNASGYTQPISGVVTDTQTVTDNAAFTDGTTKLFCVGFVYDETAGTALTENDAAAARINVNRALVSAIEDGSTRGRYATVSASNALKVDGSAVTQPTKDVPQTSGGVTATKLISAASTNATNIKGSAGQVYGIFATNINASPRYLKIYNKATTPTVGTDTPIQTYLIPGNTSGAGFTRYIRHGIPCSNGIGIALTTGVGDADTGAVAANEIVVNLEYA